MMKRARTARSRAVEYWLGSGSPVELVKLEPVSPISWPSWFIILAKVSSVPPMPSASAMAASLPDWMMTERSRSETFTFELSSANMVEPPEAAPPSRQACSEMKNSSFIDSLPRCSSSKTTATVISFAMLAGSSGSSAALWNSSVPDS
jgi:hypothetical protein